MPVIPCRQSPLAKGKPNARLKDPTVRLFIQDLRIKQGQQQIVWQVGRKRKGEGRDIVLIVCLLYTSDAADE